MKKRMKGEERKIKEKGRIFPSFFHLHFLFKASQSDKQSYMSRRDVTTKEIKRTVQTLRFCSMTF